MWNFCNVKSQRLFFSGTLRSGWKIWRFLLAVLIALEHTSLLSDLCLPLEMLRNNGDLPKRGFREQQTQIRGLSHGSAESSGVQRAVPQVLPTHLGSRYQIWRKPASPGTAAAWASRHLRENHAQGYYRLWNYTASEGCSPFLQALFMVAVNHSSCPHSRAECSVDARQGELASALRIFL